MSWKTVHANLSHLARSKAALDAEEARWLVRAVRERVHVLLGYGSIAEYLERIFGYGPRLAHEKIRVAEALEALPALRRRLESAELCWSAVRELSRVATPETEPAWIEAALGKSVREVERMVSGRRPGDTPDAPPDAGAMNTVLRLEISADTLAAFREAREACTRAVGHRLRDDEVVRMICERALCVETSARDAGDRDAGAGEPGDRDAGGSRYQVKIAVCPECGRGERAAAGELHPMAPARVEQALCDAQIFAGNPAPGQRATQTIPPATRRSVLRRDGGCSVPGCRNSAFREIHHVVPRAAGGNHDRDLLAPLCSAHHAQVHAGRIRITGTFSDGFRVEHADGRRYGTQPLSPSTWAASRNSAIPQGATFGTDIAAPPVREAGNSAAVRGAARAADASAACPDHVGTEAQLRADALAGLRQLGFRDREARRALGAARGSSLEELLRNALARLGTPTRGGARRGQRACEPAGRWCGPTLAVAAPR